MTAPAYLVPEPVRRACSLLPAYPGSLLFVAGLNVALRRHLPDDVLQMLHGRSLRIHVQDAGIAFDFVWRDGAFRAARHDDPIDLVIRANLYDFYLLAQRQEDPDTLFFNRRLVLEGDTELGLMVKNSLDAIDLSSVLSPQALPGYGLLQRLRPSR